MRRWLLLLFVLPILLRADGGKLILHGDSAGETISLFADPYPVRAGEPCDFSALIQRGPDAVLDGAVILQVGGLTLHPTHDAANNKLLFAATATLPTPGNLPISVSHGSARISGELAVTEPTPAVITYWPYFAVVPVAIGLFVLNRYLKRRRELVTSA